MRCQNSGHVRHRAQYLLAQLPITWQLRRIHADVFHLRRLQASLLDDLEFLIAGCTAVQVGTATFVNPKAIAEVHDGIAAYLATKGFATLAELPRYLPRD